MDAAECALLVLLESPALREHQALVEAAVLIYAAADSASPRMLDRLAPRLREAAIPDAQALPLLARSLEMGALVFARKISGAVAARYSHFSFAQLVVLPMEAHELTLGHDAFALEGVDAAALEEAVLRKVCDLLEHFAAPEDQLRLLRLVRPAFLSLNALRELERAIMGVTGAELAERQALCAAACEAAGRPPSEFFSEEGPPCQPPSQSPFISRFRDAGGYPRRGWVWADDRTLLCRAREIGECYPEGTDRPRGIVEAIARSGDPDADWANPRQRGLVQVRTPSGLTEHKGGYPPAEEQLDGFVSEDGVAKSKTLHNSPYRAAEAGHWYELDLRGFEARITAYRIRHGHSRSNDDDRAPRHWVIQASNRPPPTEASIGDDLSCDVDDGWVTLDERGAGEPDETISADPSVEPRLSEATFQVQAPSQQFFRRFRFKKTRRGSSMFHAAFCRGLELYGELRRSAVAGAARETEMEVEEPEVVAFRGNVMAMLAQIHAAVQDLQPPPPPLV